LTARIPYAIIRYRIVTFDARTLKGKAFMKKTRRPVRLVLSLVLCAACLIGLIPPVSAQAETQRDTVLTTLVYYRNDSDSDVIGRLEQDTQLTVLGETQNYYQIDCYEFRGYISKEQVRVNRLGQYFVDCKEGHRDTVVTEVYTRAETLKMRTQLISWANSRLGDPYVYGGARPGAFDCSGLMLWLYEKQGITLNRRSTTQLENGIIISRESAQPGDLVFFREPWDPCLTSHVGIYIGNNMIIHAGSKGVSIANLDGYWFADYYLCIRRIIVTESVEVETLIEKVAPSVFSGQRLFYEMPIHRSAIMMVM